MKALTQEQFTKLPKYAQAAIQSQQIEIRMLREKLDRTLAAQKPSPFRINLGDGSDREYGFIDAQTIEVVLDQKDGDIDMENVIGIRVEQHPVVGKRLQIMSRGHPSTLHISPQSSNVVNITTERY